MVLDLTKISHSVYTKIKAGYLNTRLYHEATAGFEPAHQAFAEPCLTTWPRRHEG